MVVKFSHQILNICNGEYVLEDFPYISSLPDACPICRTGISPEFILINTKNEHVTELLCGCPRNECGSLFFTVYAKDTRALKEKFDIVSYYPLSKEVVNFSEEIMLLSPNFVEIYQQSLHAEHEQLNLICGVGFRKSIEYLIKDYAIDISGEEEGMKIKSLPLQQCINKYINHPTIKEVSKRAVWLGNDETHFVKKWKDKDIQDLKKLINLTVHYISMELLANRYQLEMEIK